MTSTPVCFYGNAHTHTHTQEGFHSTHSSHKLNEKKNTTSSFLFATRIRRYRKWWGKEIKTKWKKNKNEIAVKIMHSQCNHPTRWVKCCVACKFVLYLSSASPLKNASGWLSTEYYVVCVLHSLSFPLSLSLAPLFAICAMTADGVGIFCCRLHLKLVNEYEERTLLMLKLMQTLAFISIMKINRENGILSTPRCTIHSVRHSVSSVYCTCVVRLAWLECDAYSTCNDAAAPQTHNCSAISCIALAFTILLHGIETAQHKIFFFDLFVSLIASFFCSFRLCARTQCSMSLKEP